jgi:hypothetical protein
MAGMEGMEVLGEADMTAALHQFVQNVRGEREGGEEGGLGVGASPTLPFPSPLRH